MSFKPTCSGFDPVRPLDPVPTLYIEVTIPPKCFINFWTSLDLCLINCEVQFDLLWRDDCLLIELNINITGVDFRVTSTKIH